MKISPIVASVALVILAMTTPALADIEVTFRESAPKDRFIIRNTGDCTVGPTMLTIDLGGSSAGLIFDVTSQGAGVEVFQPFDVVEGAANLASQPVVRDGDNSVTLDLLGLDQGDQVAFTIDVDDTMGAREITVSGSEIAGASARIGSGSSQQSGTFGTNAVATVPAGACLS